MGGAVNGVGAEGGGPSALPVVVGSDSGRCARGAAPQFGAMGGPLAASTQPSRQFANNLPRRRGQQEWHPPPMHRGETSSLRRRGHLDAESRVIYQSYCRTSARLKCRNLKAADVPPPGTGPRDGSCSTGPEGSRRGRRGGEPPVVEWSFGRLAESLLKVSAHVHEGHSPCKWKLCNDQLRSASNFCMIPTTNSMELCADILAKFSVVLQRLLGHERCERDDGRGCPFGSVAQTSRRDTHAGTGLA